MSLYIASLRFLSTDSSTRKEEEKEEKGREEDNQEESNRAPLAVEAASLI